MFDFCLKTSNLENTRTYLSQDLQRSCKRCYVWRLSMEGIAQIFFAFHRGWNLKPGSLLLFAGGFFILASWAVEELWKCCSSCKECVGNDLSELSPYSYFLPLTSQNPPAQATQIQDMYYFIPWCIKSIWIPSCSSYFPLIMKGFLWIILKNKRIFLSRCIALVADLVWNLLAITALIAYVMSCYAGLVSHSQ